MSAQLAFNDSVLLAPMAGVNDPVFRRICRRLGADLSYSEMISAAGLAHNNMKTFDMLYVDETERPLAVQLFGKDPAMLAAQAQALEESHGDWLALIDINMGCPARKIAGKGEGAALMRDPELAARIISAVADAVALPVTVKFRRGYYEGDEIAIDFARMAEASGAAAVAVHGRWAVQMYRGESDKGLIGRVKQAVSIPVIASGDVYTVDDILHYLREQGADAVMAARGAQGNPWLFAEARAVLGRGGAAGDTRSGQPDACEALDGKYQAVASGCDSSSQSKNEDREPSPVLNEDRGRFSVLIQSRVAVAREHTLGLYELFPRRLPSMRKHIAWYFKGVPGATAIRRAVNECVSIDDYLRLLDAIEEGRHGGDE